jgi:hypothetical protein
MLLWEIAEENLPFHHEKDILEIRNLIVQKNRPTFSSNVPHEWVDISSRGIINLFPYLLISSEIIK